MCLHLHIPALSQLYTLADLGATVDHGDKCALYCVLNNIVNLTSANIIAALTSNRTNLSPFTKGCRDGGASMRMINFWMDFGPVHDCHKRVIYVCY